MVNKTVLGLDSLSHHCKKSVRQDLFTGLFEVEQAAYSDIKGLC